MYLRVMEMDRKADKAPAVEEVKEVLEKWMVIQEMRTSKDGKFKIICVDKFNGESFVYGWCDNAKSALKAARALTMEAMVNASDGSVATVFYAYAPDGAYLGGDVWKGE